jgi:hypothetical protein
MTRIGLILHLLDTMPLLKRQALTDNIFIVGFADRRAGLDCIAIGCIFR